MSEDDKGDMRCRFSDKSSRRVINGKRGTADRQAPDMSVLQAVALDAQALSAIAAGLSLEKVRVREFKPMASTRTPTWRCPQQSSAVAAWI
ncbi:hypothetical protein I6F07_32345 [Ensifer sp. IC4062]|nr:hypothetical protein [Ensifer sp. IC4062]MCA1444772.1 hypothetical protein [Ensifer sp. IC4062]